MLTINILSLHQRGYKNHVRYYLLTNHNYPTIHYC